MSSLRAIQFVDLGFGDSGKGSFVDFAAYKYKTGLVV